MSGDIAADRFREEEGGTLRVAAVVTLAYFVLGVLGLGFAIPPGYASPIFPAAGLAVAALLQWGRGLWPAVWLGSFALNIWAGRLQGGLTLEVVVLAAGMATGAALQALVASAAVSKRLGDAWRTLETERSVVATLLLAGPLACLVSASIGVGCLLLAGIISPQDVGFSWWNWWSGDTLGVLVLLPLSLTVLRRREPLWRMRLAALVLPMLVALSVVAATFVAVSRWERERQKLAIADHGEVLAKALERRFIAHQEVLSALRRLYELAPGMTYPQFEHFTRITLKDNPDIFALSINPYVSKARRPGFEREMAAKTANLGFEIKERNSAGKLVRAGDREAHVAVAFIAPLEGNRPAVGYDIYSEPVRRAAIDRAIQSRLPVVTSPIQLVQENRKRVGTLLLHPAYFGEEGGSDPPVAFAVGVIKVDELVEIATRSHRVAGLAFSLEDLAAPAERSLLYRSESIKAGTDEWRLDLKMADRTWTLRVQPTQAYLSAQRHWIPFAVGAGGMMLAALLQVLLLVTTGRNEIVNRRVREQTSELRAKGEALADRNAQLDALFSLSPDGFVAIGRDDIVRFVNPAFVTITGISTESIAGRSAAVLDEELRRRAEHPEAFPGLAGYFIAGDAFRPARALHLRQPQGVIISLVGIFSESPTIARILYVRDITREAEIDRLKSEFLSHAAHELRTPMASIFGFSEILLEMELDAATRRELIETIHRQTKLLVDIINELLDLARIEARRGKDLKLAAVELGPLLRRALDDLAIDQAQWPTVLDLPATPIRVRADEAKLGQAFSNVVANARKYSTAGGEIRVDCVVSGAMAGIRVADHGIGMSPEQLARFGERFWRADPSGKTPGTGLGVAIVKEIMAMLGGRLDVESRQGQGTVVTLWVPVEQTEPGAAGGT